MHLFFSSRGAAGLHEVCESLEVGKRSFLAGLDVSGDTLKGPIVARVQADDKGDHGMADRPVLWLGMFWISHARESNRGRLPRDYRPFGEGMEGWRYVGAESQEEDGEVCENQ
jgi:hypothetical protein